MAVLRKEKHEHYTVIDNSVFMDYTLSMKALGLLCKMLSLPDDWNYSIAGLAELVSDGETAVRSTLKELEDAGYFYREQVRENGRIVKTEYVISEYKNCDFPLVENPQLENLDVENEPQLNTKESNTKKSNTKSYRFVPPTLEEVKEYIAEKGYNINAEEFVNFYASKGWVVGRTKMVDWKASVRYWASKRFESPRQPDRPRDFMDLL